MKRRLVLRIAKRVVRSVCPAPIWRWIEASYYSKFGEPELSLLPYLCDPDRDAIDVGANVGCYTLFMRHHARHVYAFEPIPWLAVGLARKFSADDVTICPMALSRSSGCAKLHIPVVDGHDVTGLSSLTESDGASAFARHDIEVPTCPLDHAFTGDAGFVKIDVEGHEESVLEGARATIARCRPNVLIESEERHTPGAVEHIYRYFDSFRYRGYFLRDGHLRSIDHFDPRTMQKVEDVIDLGTHTAQVHADGYTNNFLFLPDERAETIRTSIESAIA